MSECNPKLLDLIPKNKEWMINKQGERTKNESSSSYENNKLELRLGLPGDDECWSTKKDPIFSLNYLPDQQQKIPTNQNLFMPKESPHLPSYCNRSVKLQSNPERKASSSSTVSANTAVNNTSQKRAAPTPVVGWPPIRSCRKNLGSSSSNSAKPASEPSNEIPTKSVTKNPSSENSCKGHFVKINMDGVPIGRKVDLSIYDNYGNLSSAVDELFRGLLAAQTDSSSGGIVSKQENPKPITGLLDGSGEYTLVYEDNEGDRMLVGDVPWHMFVSTVKRLRVLKSSDLTFSRGQNKAGKINGG